MTELLALLFYLAGFAGWCMNIAAIWHSHEVTGPVIARIVGVFLFPLGAVLGWL